MIQARVDAGDGVFYSFRFTSLPDHVGRHSIQSVEILTNSPANVIVWNHAEIAVKNVSNGREITTRNIVADGQKITAHIASPLLFADAVAMFLLRFTADLYPSREEADIRKLIRYLPPHCA